MGMSWLDIDIHEDRELYPPETPCPRCGFDTMGSDVCPPCEEEHERTMPCPLCDVVGGHADDCETRA